MAFKYKATQKAEPGVKGGGTKKWYAISAPREEFDIDKLTRQIERMSTVSGADIRAVVYALIDVAADALADGNIVRLGELGSLRVSLESKGVAKEDEVNAGIIDGAHINFSPGEKLKKMTESLDFQKG